MDPVTIFATATALWSGVKTAVEYGREAEDILGQLGKWATAVADLQLYFEVEQEKPSIFKKPVFKKSATAEALDKFTVKKQLEQQEMEIYRMFIYGPLSHLGKDGYTEWWMMRLEIKKQRDLVINEWKHRRKKFYEDCILWGSIGAMVFTTVLTIGGILYYRFTVVEPYNERNHPTQKY
jgi:hypothetical protein